MSPPAGCPRQVRVDSPATEYDDRSLELAYLNDATDYKSVCELLRRWYPKMTAGGTLAGSGYADGIIGGRVFGVRTAVNEFAREHDLLVRVTYDKVPSWVLTRPAPALPGRRLGILTAAANGAVTVAEQSVPNKRAWAARHGYELLFRTSGFDAERPAAWSKITFLREHLGDFDWLFWSDADSLVMDPTRLMEHFLDDEFDVVITQEDLGVGVFNLNTGQMFVRNTPWSHGFLEEVYAQKQFVHDRLWENRAVIHLWEREDLSGHVKVLAQTMFNSYLANYTRGDFILHFPDMPNDKRRDLMRYWAQFAGA